MLNKNTLEREIKKAFDETFPSAFENALLTTFIGQSSVGSDVAKQFGKSITDAIAGPMSKRLAAAIDYYVRNITIYGTVLTTGSPVTQQAVIMSPSPLTNGKVPNSLGVK